MRVSIRKQLMFLSLCITLPLLLVGAANLYQLWHSSKSNLNRSVEQQSQLAAIALERWLEAQLQPLTTVAEYMAEHRGLPVNFLPFMVGTRPYWIDIRLLDAGGKEGLPEPAHAAPLSPQISNVLLKAFDERRLWSIATDWTGDAQNPVLAFAVPVKGGGAVVARARVEAMRDIFRDVELTTGEVLTVIDSQGRILYRSSIDQEAGEYVGESMADSPLLTALDGRRTMLFEIESPFDGVRRVHGLARAGETGYTIKIGVPSTALYAPARKQFERYALYSIVALACALFAAFAFAQNISKPVLRLSEAARRIGGGEAHIRTEGGGGGEVGALGAAFDSMAEQIARREARLKELNDLKSEIVSSVSHELRTPLATIKTLAAFILRNEPPEQERRESLEIIAQECDRQIDLVTNLLDLSSIEAGTFPYQPARTDTLQLLDTCLRIERHQVELHRHQLIADLPEHLPPVYTDSKAIRRVICTLIENAIKYTPDGGRITLGARAAGQLVIVEISDTGRGISAADMPHIFKKFYRGHQAAGRTGESGEVPAHNIDVPADVPGVGLGLYLARTIIERLDGKLEVRSELGKGSAFNVSLPVWSE